jgi:signal transduction histidine kinase
MWCVMAMASARSDHAPRLLGSQPARLALLALAILGPVTALFALFIGWQVDQTLSTRTLDALRDELLMFRSEFDRGGAAALSTAVAQRSAQGGPGFYRFDAPGLAQAAGNLKETYPQVGENGLVFEIMHAETGRMHAVAGVAVPVPTGGRLLVVRDIEDQVAFSRNLRRTAFGGVAGLTGLALALGWFANRRFARRISDMTATSRSIMAGDLARRIPRDHSEDDLDLLAGDLNAMLARIEELLQTLREVSDNIAHDLKTPLTRLRNHAEAALRDEDPLQHRDGLERTIEEADGLIKTFNALLLIARLEAGAVDRTREMCDVAALVADVAELYQPVADEAGLSLKLSSSAPAMFAVNRQLIGQAVANLVDNAIKYSAGTHTAGHGPIVVEVASLPDGGVTISVGDRGPGISINDRERAVKRFVRLEQSRSRPGTGLGLSLVAAVARLHGGTVQLDDHAPGLRVTMSFPGPQIYGDAARAQSLDG